MNKKQTEKHDPPPVLLRVEQVAVRLNVSRSTVYLWCDHGKLERVKLGDGCIRITEASVAQLVENGFIRGRY
jgi:excisionase family DNA binding protein